MMMLRCRCTLHRQQWFADAAWSQSQTLTNLSNSNYVTLHFNAQSLLRQATLSHTVLY